MSLGEKLRNARLSKKLSTSEVAAATRMQVQLVEDLEREDFSRITAPIYGKGFIRLYAEHVGLDPKLLVDEYISRFVASKTSLRKDKTQGSAAIAPTKAPPRQERVAGQVSQRSEKKASGSDNEIDLFSLAEKTREQAEEGGEELEPGSFATPGEDHKVQEECFSKPNTTRLGGLGRSQVSLITGRVIQRATGLWKRAIKTLREKLRSIHHALQTHEFSLFKIEFAKSPIKSFSVILGILIVLVFVISCLYRCVKSSQSEALPPSAEKTQAQLRLAIEPPPPYFD